MRARRRSLARRLLRMGAWSLALILVLFSGSLVFVSTDMGRSWLLDRAIASINDTIPGSLSIRELEGSVLGSPRLIDVDLLDRGTGAKVVHIDEIAADFELGALLSKHVVAERFSIEGLALDLGRDATGRMRLFDALVDPSSSPDEEDDDASPGWSVAIDEIRIANSSLALDSRDPRVGDVDELDLSITDVIGQGGRWSGRLSELTAQIEVCGKPRKLSLEGSIELDGDQLRFFDAKLSLGQTEIALGSGHAALDLSTVLFDSLELLIDEELLACAAPRIAWQRALKVRASVSRPISTEGFEWRLEMGGRLNVQGTFAPDDRSISTHLELDQLQPQDWIGEGSWPAASISGSLELSATLENLHRPAVSADGTLFGSFGAYVVDELKLEALRLQEDGSVSGELRLTAHGANAKVAIDGHWDGKRIALTSVPLAVSIPDLSRLPAAETLTGALSLEGQASGTWPGLAVSATLSGKSIARGRDRVRRLRLSIQAPSLPEPSRSKAALLLEGARVAGRELGRVDVTVEPTATDKLWRIVARGGSAELVLFDGRAQLDARSNRVGLFVQHLVLQHRQLVAAASAGEITIDPRDPTDVHIASLSFRVADGEAELGGSTQAEIALELTRIDLGALRRDLGLDLPTRSGHLSGRLTMAKPLAAFALSAALELDALQLAQLPSPIDAQWNTQIDASDISTKLDIQAGRAGTTRVSVRTGRPARFWEPGAWQRRGAGWLKSASGTFEAFDLGVLSSMGLTGMSGSVDGQVDVGAQARHATMKVDATDLRVPGVETTANISLTSRLDQGILHVQMQGRSPVVRHAALDLSLRVPPRPGALSSPVRLRQLVESASLRLEDIRVSKLAASVPELRLPAGKELRGGLGAIDVAIGERGETANASVRFAKAQVGEHPPFDVTVNLAADRTTSRADWNIALDSLTTWTGKAELDAGLDVAEDLDLDAARKAELRATTVVAASRIKRLLSAIGYDTSESVSGSIRLTGSAVGPAEAPQLSGRLEVLQGRIAGAYFETLRGELQRDHDKIQGSLQILQAKGGRLKAAISSPHHPREGITAMIESKAFNLGFLRGLDRTGRDRIASIAGILDARIEIGGTLSAPRPSGWLRLRDGAIDLRGGLIPLEQLALNATVLGNKLELTARARSGPGEIDLAAKAAIDGLSIPPIEARLIAKKLPLAVASQVYTVDLKGHGTLRRRRGLWDLVSTIDDATILAPLAILGDKQRSLHAIDDMSDVVYVSRDQEGSQDLTLDADAPMARIRIKAPETIRVRSEEFNATVDADLDITLVGSVPVIRGTTQVTRGRAVLLSRRYDIRKAKAIFDGNVPINPRIDVLLRHEFRDLKLDVVVQGPLHMPPKIEFRSSPAGYDQATLLAIFLGQSPTGADESSAIQDSGLNLLSNIVLNELQKTVGSILPVNIDVFRIERTKNDGRAYTTGSWITDDLFVALRTEADATGLDNIVEVKSEYHIDKSWSLEGVGGDRGKGAVDIVWTRRWGD